MEVQRERTHRDQGDPVIRLIRGDCRNVQPGNVDLVLTDPPWRFDQRHGESAAEDHYACMETSEIVTLVGNLANRKPEPTVAMWCTWAHQPEVFRWLVEGEWLLPVTGGAWDKGPGRYGQGYWWAGRCEPMLVWGGQYNDRSVPLDNATNAPKKQHSLKPIFWQAQMVRRWCPPGGVVFDPFMGLGSVAMATMAAGEGRSYIGVELDEKRFDRALAEVTAAYVAEEHGMLEVVRG